MNVELIKPEELTRHHVSMWVSLLSQNFVETPFLHPEFTTAVGECRNDVEIAVIRHADEVVGYFPFQRGRRNRGVPVGHRLCDFNGGAFRSGIAFEAHRLVQSCGLNSWIFDHLPAGQLDFQQHGRETADSPYLELRSGYNTYREERKRAGSSQISQTERKSRKLEREVGTPVFRFHNIDAGALQQLAEWKTKQHRESGMLQVFRLAWVQKLVNRLLKTECKSFGGVLSTLHIGDQLIAAHFGLRTERILHWWFPAYDPEFGRYSPGSILLLELARACADRGFQRIDLGKGPERYKQSFKSGDIDLIIGSVDCRPMAKLINRTTHQLRSFVRQHELQFLAKFPKRMLRTFRYGLAEQSAATSRDSRA